MSDRQHPRALAFKIGVPIVVVAVGVLVGFVLWKTKPVAEAVPRRREATLVEVIFARSQEATIVVEAWGTVRAVQQIALQPRLTGEIVSVSKEFLPGGRFARGAAILKIDPSDYDIARRQRVSELAAAKAGLKIEMGQQTIALREYELLGETILEEDKDLVLRKPQLETAHAAVDSAKASLDRAILDLGRTDVVAPFNAIVYDRRVDLGAQVSPATTLATLVGTDEYWVEVTLPVDRLEWIEIPESHDGSGAAVRIFNEAGWGPEAFREGKVCRLASDLEGDGRMAKLLVTVKDPLCGNSSSRSLPDMLIGMYVRAEIEGSRLEGVYRLPRSALRDGEMVWVMREDSTLEIRRVTTAWRGREEVYVSEGLADGEAVVTSDIAAPVDGMEVALAAEKREKEAEAPAEETPDERDSARTSSVRSSADFVR